MSRNRSTTRSGGLFDDATIEGVWRKGQYVSGSGADEYRKDACGALMRRGSYGTTSGQYGWEIDHIQPVAASGGDELSNLQPLHWENNRGKGDNYPNWYCTKRS